MNSLIIKNPELNQEFIKTHFTSLDERYFRCFSELEIKEHLESLEKLNHEPPIVINAKLCHKKTDHAANKKLIELTFFANDDPGLFSILTGLLTGTHFEIIAGDIFTYKKNPESPSALRMNTVGVGFKTVPTKNHNWFKRKYQISLNNLKHNAQEKRFIIDRFIGLIPNSAPFEIWQEQIIKKAMKIFSLIEKQTPEANEEVKRLINNDVAKRFSQFEKKPANLLFPIQISTKFLPAYTRLKIIAEDTPAFLYSLSYALNYHKIIIEHVTIKTIKNEIHDEIDIINQKGLPIVDQIKLDKIKLAIMLTKEFTHFINYAPDSFAALQRFEELIEKVAKSNQPEEWISALTNPNIILDLAKLLGTSDYLWEDFIRMQYETLLPILKPYLTNQEKSKQILLKNYKKDLKKAHDFEEKKEIINKFKDAMLFQIDLTHILIESNFKILSKNLTKLAEIILKDSLFVIYLELIKKYGTPKSVAGFEADFCLLGLGKMGGTALGYASDIELIFIYSDSGLTSGPMSISNEEFFEKLIKELIGFIKTKRDGIFQLDFRLRPFGNDGPLATSFSTFCDYYGPQGQSQFFEKMALVRLRKLVGNNKFGKTIEETRDHLIYNLSKIKPSELWDLRKKQFQEKNIPGKLNAKFSPGALVDIEYAVQLLQLIYGQNHPNLRTPSIHKALIELSHNQIIDQKASEALINAYDFFRMLINGLRILRGSAKDLFLPEINSLEYAHLARRIGYKDNKNLDPSQKLNLDFETETALVRSFVENNFSRKSLVNPKVGTIADLIISDILPLDLQTIILKNMGFLDTKKAYHNFKSLAKKGTKKELFIRIAVLSSTIFKKLPDPDMALNNWERFFYKEKNLKNYHLLLKQPKRLEIMLTIFSLSQFLANVLINNPAYFRIVTSEKKLSMSIDDLKLEKELLRLQRICDTEDKWLKVLRKIRNREMLRIAIKDFVLSYPVTTIIAELSNLADIFLKHTLEKLYFTAFGKKDIKICLFAMGKLGSKELNYSSDIDLIAVSKDALTQEEKANIKQILKKFISVISSYTENGFLYRVDFRLRPFGMSGELFSDLSYLITYYQNQASLWEIQALLKLRPIAGNLTLGHLAIKELNKILAQKRNPQIIAQNILELREKAVKEYHKINSIDIKNDEGGIRDIEFLAQGLELMNLNNHQELQIPDTLSALNQLNQLQIINNEETAFLTKSYIYLRKIEHFLQLLEDQQIHSIAKDERFLLNLSNKIAFITNKNFQITEIENLMLKIRNIYLSYLKY
ncbi:MAG: hypothetical protein WC860_02790 [Candidatus Margulisiibacteriota bacterium]